MHEADGTGKNTQWLQNSRWLFIGHVRKRKESIGLGLVRGVAGGESRCRNYVETGGRSRGDGREGLKGRYVVER